jgi:hypothetical protein
MSTKLCIVSASLDPERTREFWSSWPAKAASPIEIFHVIGEFGVVAAFSKGVKLAVARRFDIIACFHDDLRIDEPGWDRKVVEWFEGHPRCGLVGFGGARSLGAGDIYTAPYSPKQLARGGFMSNMTDAERHGERILEPRRAVCFDGFSQIGRASLLSKLWSEVESWGIRHHLYDSILGALTAREGWETWYLPIACHHAGGQTRLGSAAYAEWAKQQHEKGDRGFWEESHRVGYEKLRDVLPLSVSE